jgi:4-aminobutyrate aminotransferase-like enzyme/Ser/Thr protein kinase RdoA (MazF antagonist)
LSEALFDRLSRGAPAIPVGDLGDLLTRDFGLVVLRTTGLSGEIDQNLRVDCSDGVSYVVKVSPAQAAEADLVWQCRLLEHLAESVPDLPAPRLRRTSTGDLLTRLVDDGQTHVVRVLSWAPGRVLDELNWRSPSLLRDIGGTAAKLANALAEIEPRDSADSHHWDLLRAPDSIAICLPYVTDPDHRALVQRALDGYERLLPTVERLPRSVVHQDLNDFNLLALPDRHRVHRISAVLDVGDAVYTIRIAELTVAVAYAMLQTPDPLRAAADVISGYAAVSPLSEDELRCLFPLIVARLCVNATTWTRRLATTSNEYGRARSQHTWPLLTALDRIPASVAEATFRSAAGLPPWPSGVEAAGRLGGTTLAGATDALAGRHLEPADGATPARSSRRAMQPATLQLGVTLARAPAEPIRSPLPPGVFLHVSADRVVTRHELQGQPIWAIWVGVRGDTEPGAPIAPDQQVGTAAGDQPSVRLVLTTSADLAFELPPERVQPWQRDVWQALCPDPAAIYDKPATGESTDSARHAIELRHRYVGHAQRYYYAEPMTLVGSKGLWLHDVDGLSYLDAINNVTHVGHADPTVADAVSRQVTRLNTNSRFVFGELAGYARRLVNLLPDPLGVVYFVCTGSEANDLALRMARQATGRRDVLVIDGAYHGNTTAVIEISPDRYDGPGGAGRPDTTHPVPTPNRYRGRYGYDDPEAGAKYAADALSVLDELVRADRSPAAFFSESLVGSGGQITLPTGYLSNVFAPVRKAGGLCVCDEVQIGFGRLGPTWGFQLHDVVPDIVTLGKPMANGMPLAAVVTTQEIAEEFDRGMKYFNTFAGNPVCCAAAMAVLDVLERDRLADRAATTGAHLRTRLRELQHRHELIGDVRGEGLYVGIELVRDRQSKEPAGTEAQHISERMREEGVVIYPNGRDANILKLKPPMTFGVTEADIVVDTLDAILSETW